MLQAVINSPVGVGFALLCGRLLPLRLAARLIDFLADRLVQQRELPLVQAVRANQAGIARRQLTPTELDLAVRDTFRYAGRFLYDLYHHQHKPESLRDLVVFTPAAEALLARFANSAGHTIVVGPHLGNFDLAARVVAQHQLPVQVVSYPQPGSGYRWQNRMRQRAGLNMTPASLDALRQARQHLQNGGIVVTGLDRPLPDRKYCPLFFGRPAPLPVLHITLALKTHAPIFVVGVIQRADGVYEIHASPEFTMERHANRHTEIMANAQRVLQAAADLISLAPQQWMMFYPVWPED